MEENEEEKNEIKIVTGDDSDLEISTVYDHLNLDRVREHPDKNNIIIPVVKKQSEEEPEEQEEQEKEDSENEDN